VTLTDVLEHVPRPLDVLARVRGFLCPGGWLAIKVPNGPAQRVKETLRARLRPSYRATIADNLVHVNHFSAAALARALTESGYTDVTVMAAAPELAGGQGAGAWGRVAAFRVARALPGGAASPLAFNLQAYGRRG
jgi:trans-aconitate methyltransferase